MPWPIKKIGRVGWVSWARSIALSISFRRTSYLFCLFVCDWNKKKGQIANLTTAEKKMSWPNLNYMNKRKKNVTRQ